MWGQVSQIGAREGKRNAQRTILKAWCVDPEFGETFATMTSSLEIKEGMKQEEEWVSRNKLEEYSESEAEELVDMGALKVRKHPDNPKRLQFMKVTTKETKQVTKSKMGQASGAQQLNKEDFKGMLHSISTVQMDHNLVANDRIIMCFQITAYCCLSVPVFHP